MRDLVYEQLEWQRTIPSQLPSLSTSLCFSFPLTVLVSWLSIHFQNLIFMRLAISALLLFFLNDVFICTRKPFQTTVCFNVSGSWWKKYSKLFSAVKKRCSLKIYFSLIIHFFFLKQVNIYILKDCHLIKAVLICNHSLLPSLVCLVFLTYYSPRKAVVFSSCFPTPPFSVASPYL